MASTSGNRRERELWRQLVTEGLVYGGDVNSRLPFTGMSQRYGKAWIDYLNAAWEARGDLTDEEFCRLNGTVPPTFLARLKSVH